MSFCIINIIIAILSSKIPPQARLFADYARDPAFPERGGREVGVDDTLRTWREATSRVSALPGWVRGGIQGSPSLIEQRILRNIRWACAYA